MLNTVRERLSGYKTYILAAIGILIAIVGHFWGPLNVGPVEVPEITTSEMWAVIWNSGLFSFLRIGVKKAEAAPAK